MVIGRARERRRRGDLEVYRREQAAAAETLRCIRPPLSPQVDPSPPFLSLAHPPPKLIRDWLIGSKDSILIGQTKRSLIAIPPQQITHWVSKKTTGLRVTERGLVLRVFNGPNFFLGQWWKAHKRPTSLFTFRLVVGRGKGATTNVAPPPPCGCLHLKDFLRLVLSLIYSSIRQMEDSAAALNRCPQGWFPAGGGR